MISITIGSNKKPSTNHIDLGNQWENNSLELSFVVPSDYQNFHKYILGTKIHNGEQIFIIQPLENDSITITTLFTQYEGDWFLSLMCREQELEFTTDEIDLTPREDETVFVSDSFTGHVGKCSVKTSTLTNTKFKFKV